MPASCCVFGCSKARKKDPVQFYRIPIATNHRFLFEKNILSAERRKRWFLAINRADLNEDTPTKVKNARVCSDHFISGKPAALEDRDNPDWAPCQNMGYSHALHWKEPAERDRHSKDNLEELSCGDHVPEQGLLAHTAHNTMEDFTVDVIVKQEPTDGTDYSTFQVKEDPLSNESDWNNTSANHDESEWIAVQCCDVDIKDEGQAEFIDYSTGTFSTAEDAADPLAVRRDNDAQTCDKIFRTHPYRRKRHGGDVDYTYKPYQDYTYRPNQSKKKRCVPPLPYLVTQNTEDDFRCWQCSATFKDLGDFDIHLAAHNSSALMCVTCGGLMQIIYGIKGKRCECFANGVPPDKPVEVTSSAPVPETTPVAAVESTLKEIYEKNASATVVVLEERHENEESETTEPQEDEEDQFVYKEDLVMNCSKCGLMIDSGFETQEHRQKCQCHRKVPKEAEVVLLGHVVDEEEEEEKGGEEDEELEVLVVKQEESFSETEEISPNNSDNWTIRKNKYANSPMPSPKYLWLACYECGNIFDDFNLLYYHWVTAERLECRRILKKKSKLPPDESDYLSSIISSDGSTTSTWPDEMNDSVCSVCNGQFESFDDLRVHWRSTSCYEKRCYFRGIAKKKMYECLNCPTRFPTRLHLAKHMVRYLANPVLSIRDENGDPISDSDVLSKKLFATALVHPRSFVRVCPVCRARAYSNKSYFIRHLNKHQKPNP